MRKLKLLSRFTAFIATLVVLTCGLSSTAMAASRTLILATTTSTQDSGLLDDLIPMFQKQSGYFVKTIAVGSGQAMAMGQKGEADVLLVHSPDAEKKFISEGAGISRKLVMHNDFILVGPANDPAKAHDSKNSAEAFKKIADHNALFLSRGDNSGTHAKEKGLWKAAGVTPEKQKWYQQTGLGMGQTLSVADEKHGYTLTDRATFLALKKTLKMAIILEGDHKLLNVYHVIEVNPAKWPKVNAAGAKAFSDFMVSKKTQKEISKFGAAKYGAPLFFPDAGKDPKHLGL